MKYRILSAAIAATATLATSQAFAGMLSHDHWAALGDKQFHYIAHNGSLYEVNGGSDTSEVVENQSLRVHFRSGTEGMTNRTLNCDDPDNDLNNPGEPESWRTEEVNTYLSLAGGQTDENSDLNSPVCEVHIGPQGEVTGGYVLNNSVTFGGGGILEAPVHSVIDMDLQRRTTAYLGATCDNDLDPDGPPISILTARATNALFDLLMEQNGEVAAGELDSHPSAPAKPGGCTTLGITKVAIGFCDPKEADTEACLANIEKALPIPAFAAAALGIGLLGITYVSSRRRPQIQTRSSGDRLQSR